MLYRADAVIVRLFKISADDLALCQNLKVIGKHGVGVDNIDCKAATEHGIPVVYTPTANAGAVAEYAVALMMALARKIGPASIAIGENRFGDRNQFQGIELAGKTLGLIGLGRIGQRVANIASAGLGMRVLAYDPFLNKEAYDGPASLQNTLEEVLSQSDFVTLHVSLTEETHYLIDELRLSQMKPGCRIINTSRGAIIKEEALVQALEEGLIAGVALDVFETEPIPANHPFSRAPNALLTPHISSSTRESLDHMARDSAQGVLDVLQGRPPQYVANAEVFKA